jgi:hypothetical protein
LYHPPPQPLIKSVSPSRQESARPKEASNRYVEVKTSPGSLPVIDAHSSRLLFRLLFSEREADPSNDGIPLPVFRGRIIDQDAIHGCVHAVTAIVPGSSIANARHCEEMWCHPFILNIGGRALLCKKSGGDVVLRIGNGSHSQICSVVACKKAPPCAALGRSCILGENTHRDINFGTGTRDNKLPPSRALRKGCHRGEADDQESNKL